MTVTIAVGNRLETQHLLSGRVPVEGFEVEWHTPGSAPAPIFPSMVTTRPYDVGELTISNFIVARDHGVKLQGLPVFPNVFFPLTGITVNKNAGIKSPADLRGKRIGVPLGFASNPAVWLRGILAHHFDVSAESITWIEGENDSLKDIPYNRSRRYRSETVSGQTDALEAGDIDAMIVAGGRAAAEDAVERLVPEPYPALKAYFGTTNVIPINTMLVTKEESAAANPGLAGAVTAASRKANAIYHAEEPDEGDHQGLNAGKMRALGIFPRGHGLDVHGDSVRMMVQYLYEQGLIKRLWTLEELFVPGAEAM